MFTKHSPPLMPWNDFAFYLNNRRVVIFSSVWHKSCSWCLINLKLTSNKLFQVFFLILTLIIWFDWHIIQSDGELILFFSLILKADHYWVTTNKDIWCGAVLQDHYWGSLFIYNIEKTTENRKQINKMKWSKVACLNEWPIEIISWVIECN